MVPPPIVQPGEMFAFTPQKSTYTIDVLPGNERYFTSITSDIYSSDPIRADIYSSDPTRGSASELELKLHGVQVKKPPFGIAQSQYVGDLVQSNYDGGSGMKLVAPGGGGGGAVPSNDYRNAA